MGSRVNKYRVVFYDGLETFIVASYFTAVKEIPITTYNFYDDEMEMLAVVVSPMLIEKLNN